MASFAFASLACLALLAFSALVMRAGRHEPASRWLSLLLAALAAWCIAAFGYRAFQSPPEGLVAATYKAAFSLDTFCFSFIFLFGHALRHGRDVRKPALVALFASDAFFVAASWSGLLIRGVRVGQGPIALDYGPLYAAFLASLALKSVLFIYQLAMMRKESQGAELVLANLILWGFITAFLVLISAAGIYPLATGREQGRDWVYLVITLPALLTAYAMLRYRMLEVRIAARQGLSYLISVCAFALPALGMLALLRYGLRYSTEAQAAFALTFLVLTVMTAPAVKRLTDRASTRFFHAGLYEPEPLLNEISSDLDTTIGVARGTKRAAARACRELGLQNLVLAIPAENGGTRLLGCRFGQDGKYEEVDEEDRRELSIYRDQPATMIAGARSGSGGAGSEGGVWEKMDGEGFFCLVPATAPSGWTGNLLAGRRVNMSEPDGQDIDFLKNLADALGLFMEKRLLSSRLMEKLEELGASTRELAGRLRLQSDATVIASHELRTPLTSVVGYLFLLKEKAGRLDRRDKMECLDSIGENIERLERIMSTLEEVNRMRDGRFRPRRERVGAEELVLRTRMLFSSEENHRIGYLLPEENLELWTDPYLSLLILRNLLSNALGFSPPGSPVLLTLQPGPDLAVLRVTDRGPGIDLGLVEEAFQPFTRLEDVDKHQRGAGLGLYAARLAAQLLGTRIEVETEPGRGSTFSFALPLAGRAPA